MKKTVLICALCVIAAQVQAEGMIGKSLCRAQEMVVFSCNTGKKRVSVCASEGYVQYRFGSEDKIELSFPDPKTPPTLFVTGGHLMYSGGGGAYMRFNKDVYSYVVYSGIGKGWDKQGVAVEKDGRLVSDIPCKDFSVSNIGSDFFQQQGIPEDDIGFEIP